MGTCKFIEGVLKDKIFKLFTCNNPNAWTDKIDCPRLMLGRVFVVDGRTKVGCVGEKECDWNEEKCNNLYDDWLKLQKENKFIREKEMRETEILKKPKSWCE